MIETPKRGAANTMEVQDGDGSLPAQAGSSGRTEEGKWPLGWGKSDSKCTEMEESRTGVGAESHSGNSKANSRREHQKDN